MNKEITINRYGNLYKERILDGVLPEKRWLERNYRMETFMSIIRKIKMESIRNQDLPLEWMENIELEK